MLARERSGEEGCWESEGGRRVGESLLRIPKLLSPMVSAISVPLASWMLECQRSSCALKSPITIASVSGRKGSMFGLYPVAQLLAGGMYKLMIFMSPTFIIMFSMYGSWMEGSCSNWIDS